MPHRRTDFLRRTLSKRSYAPHCPVPRRAEEPTLSLRASHTNRNPPPASPAGGKRAEEKAAPRRGCFSSGGGARGRRGLARAEPGAGVRPRSRGPLASPFRERLDTCIWAAVFSAPRCSHFPSCWPIARGKTSGPHTTEESGARRRRAVEGRGRRPERHFRQAQGGFRRSFPSPSVGRVRGSVASRVARPRAPLVTQGCPSGGDGGD